MGTRSPYVLHGGPGAYVPAWGAGGPGVLEKSAWWLTAGARRLTASRHGSYVPTLGCEGAAEAPAAPRLLPPLGGAMSTTAVRGLTSASAVDGVRSGAFGRAFQDGSHVAGRASPLAKQAVGWRGRTIDGSSAHDATLHVAGVAASHARTLRPNEDALPLGCVKALVAANGTWSNAAPATDVALGCRPKVAAGALHRLGFSAPLAAPQAPGASPPETTSRPKLLPG